MRKKTLFASLATALVLSTPLIASAQTYDYQDSWKTVKYSDKWYVIHDTYRTLIGIRSASVRAIVKHSGVTTFKDGYQQADLYVDDMVRDGHSHSYTTI